MFRKLAFGLVFACNGDVADEEAAGAHATGVACGPAADVSGGPSDPRVLMVRAPRALLPKPMLPSACSNAGTGELARSIELDGSSPTRPTLANELGAPSCAADRAERCAEPELPETATLADGPNEGTGPEVAASVGNVAEAARILEGPE